MPSKEPSKEPPNDPPATSQSAARKRSTPMLPDGPTSTSPLRNASSADGDDRRVPARIDTVRSAEGRPTALNNTTGCASVLHVTAILGLIILQENRLSVLFLLLN